MIEDDDETSEDDEEAIEDDEEIEDDDETSEDDDETIEDDEDNDEDPKDEETKEEDNEEEEDEGENGRVALVMLIHKSPWTFSKHSVLTPLAVVHSACISPLSMSGINAVSMNVLVLMFFPCSTNSGPALISFTMFTEWHSNTLMFFVRVSLSSISAPVSLLTR